MRVILISLGETLKNWSYARGSPGMSSGSLSSPFLIALCATSSGSRGRAGRRSSTNSSSGPFTRGISDVPPRRFCAARCHQHKLLLGRDKGLSPSGPSCLQEGPELLSAPPDRLPRVVRRDVQELRDIGVAHLEQIPRDEDLAVLVVQVQKCALDLLLELFLSRDLTWTRALAAEEGAREQVAWQVVELPDFAFPAFLGLLITEHIPDAVLHGAAEPAAERAFRAAAVEPIQALEEVEQSFLDKVLMIVETSNRFLESQRHNLPDHREVLFEEKLQDVPVPALRCLDKEQGFVVHGLRGISLQP